MGLYASTKRTVTIADARRCAVGMMQAGGAANHVRPSIKQALAYAICSANTSLERNGWQAKALREYMQANGGKLPTDVETVKRITKAAGYQASVNTALFITLLEHADQAGELHDLSIMPSNAHGWLLWRQAAKRIKGIGWKTASFAALLMWPLDCPLVPVDRHVVQRLQASGVLAQVTKLPSDIVLQKIGSSGMPNARLYRAIERLVGNEKLREGHADEPTGLHHWAKWSERRLYVGAEGASDDMSIESHAWLSPYWL